MGFCVCDHLTMNLLNLSLYDLLALSKPLTLSLPLSGTQPSSTPRLETNLSLPIPAWNPSSQAQCLGCDHQAPWGGGGSWAGLGFAASALAVLSSSSSVSKSLKITISRNQKSWLITSWPCVSWGLAYICSSVSCP